MKREEFEKLVTPEYLKAEFGIKDIFIKDLQHILSSCFWMGRINSKYEYLIYSLGWIKGMLDIGIKVEENV
jgi:hypothetical protein